MVNKIISTQGCQEGVDDDTQYELGDPSTETMYIDNINDIYLQYDNGEAGRYMI